MSITSKIKIILSVGFMAALRVAFPKLFLPSTKHGTCPAAQVTGKVYLQTHFFFSAGAAQCHSAAFTPAYFFVLCSLSSKATISFYFPSQAQNSDISSVGCSAGKTDLLTRPKGSPSTRAHCSLLAHTASPLLLPLDSSEPSSQEPWQLLPTCPDLQNLSGLKANRRQARY